MATVKKNVPEPVPTPPTTYDVLGLTREEYQVVRNALFEYKDSAKLCGGMTMLETGETQNQIAARLHRGVFYMPHMV